MEMLRPLLDLPMQKRRDKHLFNNGKPPLPGIIRYLILSKGNL